MRTFWLFKPIKDFPDYLLCSDGTCYSTKRGQVEILKTKESNRQGYPMYGLSKKGKRIYRSIRGLLLSHFSLKKFVEPEIDCPF